MIASWCKESLGPTLWSGAERELERPEAALAGAGLVHGPVLPAHPHGPVLQRAGRPALHGALGTGPAADPGPVGQPAPRAARHTLLPGGHMHQVGRTSGKDGGPTLDVPEAPP
jgi:hypothetical protein